MIAAFIPWLAIRLVVEFVFRPHFLTPLTLHQVDCTNGCGYGISSVPQITGRIAPARHLTGTRPASRRHCDG